MDKNIDKVTNLEDSIKLKSYATPQESMFYWVDGVLCYYKNVPVNYKEKISAYISEELGELLPTRVSTNNLRSYTYFLNTPDGLDEHTLKLALKSLKKGKGTQSKDIPANSELTGRTRMLLDILDRGLWTFKEDNEQR